MDAMHNTAMNIGAEDKTQTPSTHKLIAVHVKKMNQLAIPPQLLTHTVTDAIFNGAMKDGVEDKIQTPSTQW